MIDPQRWECDEATVVFKDRSINSQNFRGLEVSGANKLHVVFHRSYVSIAYMHVKEGGLVWPLSMVRFNWDQIIEVSMEGSFKAI